MAQKKKIVKAAKKAPVQPKTYYSLKELAKDYNMTDLDGSVVGGDIATQATELARHIVSAAAEHHLK